ncbi:ABC transporter permease [Clostridium senegalense]|uniref:ABC transporter permease n=1 Tax=Clostridium senegalense TaxID=1465809 RepID=UPI001C0FD7F8|nr:ABC transporter permease [Clostridium senegalense]MBU5226720.1 ABC transporter permease [Clostridium senegalense]
MKKYIMKNKKLVALGTILFLMLWFLLYKVINNKILLPSPIEVLIEVKYIITEKTFANIIFGTLNRSVWAFFIALSFAIVLSIFSILNHVIYNFLIPFIELLKTIPTMTIVILALVWLNNDKAPILMGILSVFPILYEGLLKNIISTDEKIIHMLDVYNVQKIDVVRYVYIPKIFEGLGKIFSSTLGLTFKIVVGGEILAAPNNSIGSEIQLQKVYLNTAGVFAWIIIIVILTIIIDYIINFIGEFRGEKLWMKF